MKINIDLCVRNYNGGPCIKVSNNKKVLLEKRLSEKGNITLELEDDFALPNKLIIEHYGKNMKRDTQINSKGEIINDKGFFVHHISFDDLVLHNEIYNFPFIKDNGEKILKNNYLGFNGKFVVDVDSDNIYQWHSRWQKSLVNDSPKYDYDAFKNEIFEGKQLDKLVY